MALKHAWRPKTHLVKPYHQDTKKPPLNNEAESFEEIVAALAQLTHLEGFLMEVSGTQTQLTHAIAQGL